jgi:carboxyl-terminal processing protease
MKKHNYALIILPLLVAIAVVGGMFIGEWITSKKYKNTSIEKLQTVLDLIGSEYVDTVNLDSLVEMSLPELLSYLDPHSAYIPASELTAVNDELEGSFSGVGVSFQILNDSVVVVEVISGGPAEKVGIQAGDRIVSADKKDLTGSDITSDDVFKTLKGEKGTKVSLKIKRPSATKLLSYDVIRGDIPVNSVDASYLIDDGIGYVKVGKFARNTYQEFYNAVMDLKLKGAEKLIVDLRGNGGGFMDQAIEMANEFLPEKKIIVYTKARTRDNEVMALSDGSGNFQDMELTVLCDEYSASASEIFAGAIQDNDRGLVIGRRTFGKGLVQNQIPLPDNSAIRLTVARYYTPSGRSIQKDYKRGKDGKYELDIVERYNHGEFYSADSIKMDKSKLFHTVGGREVYGGGGIMPDIFVPEDTIGYTTYYINVANDGLLQKYAFKVADNYRDILKGVKSLDKMLVVIPRDEMLLNNFVNYAAANGHPARWYYINKSSDKLLQQIKALVARDVLGYQSYFEMANKNDRTVQKALQLLKQGKSPALIKK